MRLRNTTSLMGLGLNDSMVWMTIKYNMIFLVDLRRHTLTEECKNQVCRLRRLSALFYIRDRCTFKHEENSLSNYLELSEIFILKSNI